MATNLRLVSLIKQNRAFYSTSSRFLARNVRLPNRLLEVRNYGEYRNSSVWAELQKSENYE